MAFRDIWQCHKNVGLPFLTTPSFDISTKAHIKGQDFTFKYIKGFIYRKEICSCLPSFQISHCSQNDFSEIILKCSKNILKSTLLSDKQKLQIQMAWQRISCNGLCTRQQRAVGTAGDWGHHTLPLSFRDSTSWRSMSLKWEDVVIS